MSIISWFRSVTRVAFAKIRWICAGFNWDSPILNRAPLTTNKKWEAKMPEASDLIFGRLAGNKICCSTPSASPAISSAPLYRLLECRGVNPQWTTTRWINVVEWWDRRHKVRSYKWIFCGGQWNHDAVSCTLHIMKICNPLLKWRNEETIIS